MAVEPERRPAERPLLRVRDLAVTFRSRGGVVHAVRGVDVDLARGESLAVVGQSGSGKSTMFLALLGLLPGNADVSGSAHFDGRELLGLRGEPRRRIRGRRIAMIFQDPTTAFNPVLTVGLQIAEAMVAHETATWAEARRRAGHLLELVGVPEPGIRLNQYPHEFSGGMRRRALIAMAIANRPEVLIADEPTGDLDVTISAQVLEVLATIRAETGAGMILITHDLGVVAGTADRVLVMHDGRAVEHGLVDDVFERPGSPHTRALLAAVPRLDGYDRHRVGEGR